MSALIKFLPSGNYFQNFKVTGTTMVSFDYCDRRRNGQVARRYLITFASDSLKVIDIMAVSAAEGRVEHFSTCKMLETAKGLIRKARIEAFEEEFEAEIEALKAEKAKKEPVKVEPMDPFFCILVAVAVVLFIVIGVSLIISILNDPEALYVLSTGALTVVAIKWIVETVSKSPKGRK